MLVHAFDCPSATGELPICTCGAFFRFVLEFGDAGDHPRPIQAAGRRPLQFRDWMEAETDDGSKQEMCA